MKRILAILPVTITLAASTVLAAVVAPERAHAADCTRVDVVVQLNTLTLMTKLAPRVQRLSAAETPSGCAEVVVASKSSGGATTLLGEGWPDPAKNGARPVVWMPAPTHGARC